MSEPIIFGDADYLNYLALADATFDPSGLRTPRPVRRFERF